MAVEVAQQDVARTGCDVAVIGAGFAGLSAAVKLADAGLKVVVVEQAPRLGGRATAFTDKTTGERVDNGQHALFGCYRETYAFLRTIGTADLAPLDPRLELVMADVSGHQSRLSCPPLPAPMHLLAGVLSWGALSIADRWSTVKIAPFLRDARRRGAEAVAAEVPAELTVSEWLASLGQGPVVREWLWNPLALAALNQSPDVAGARAFARVLGELFGPEPGASSLGVPAVPLDELYAEPAARFVEARGGQVLRGALARLGAEEAPGEKRRRVSFSTKKTPDVFSIAAARAVVCAVPWHALGALWAGGAPPEIAPIVKNAELFVAEPIVSVNLWFDRPVLSHRQVGLVGTQFDWAFAATSKKTSGVFFDEKDTRRLFRVTLVASGARDLLRRDNDALIALAERELRVCLGGTAADTGAIRRAFGANPGADAAASLREARRVHAVVVREPRATFSVAPGAPARPGTVTPAAGVFLAGDWTDTGLPGTIEGAVVSGHRAAREVLDWCSKGALEHQ